MSAPPGREEQVRKLKTVPGIDNPYAVAWASYNGDSEYMGAKCDACGNDVPIFDGKYASHARPMLWIDAFDPDQPREENGKWGEGGGGNGGGRGGSDKSGSGKTVTSYPKRELAPVGEHARPMPQHPVGAEANNSQKMGEYHRAAAEHFASRGEHGIAAGHEAAAAKHEKRAARERQKANRLNGNKSDDDDDDLMEMCDGSGAECKYDSVSLRGGKWVVLPSAGGEPLGIYGSREEAEAQERALKSREAAESHKSDGTVRRFEHLDFVPAELPRARITADGFLQVAGRVARTGIQEYRDSNGGIRRELRLPDEVERSLPSFPLQPLTNNHPTEMVSPENAQKYVKGAVGEAVMNADGWVTAPMTIYSADAIDAVRNGRMQLSVGYTCRLENNGGEWQGQRYDAIQRDIVVNHVALVDQARAGNQARLRLDVNDAITFACITDEQQSLNRGTNMAKLTIGGLVFDVADANAQAAFDGFAANLTKQCEEKVAAEKLRADNAEKMRDAVTAERDTAQGRLDAKNAEERQPLKLDGQEIAVADALDPVKFDAWVMPIAQARAQARASLLVEARKHLGANEKFDAHKGKDGKDVSAKSDTEIKRLVVLKLDPSAKLDGKSDEYVQARYDAAVERADKAPRAIDSARTVIAPSVVVDAGEDAASDPEAARKAMVERMLRANVRHAKHDANGKV